MEPADTLSLVILIGAPLAAMAIRMAILPIHPPRSESAAFR
jgi:hypothetical protein